jgi:Ulp1 family protease
MAKLNQFNSTGEILYLNPYGVTEKKLEAVAANWRNFVASHNTLKAYEWSTAKPAHPRQTDTVNCGIFVCHFLECLLDSDAVASFDLAEKRTKIKNKLKSNTR